MSDYDYDLFVIGGGSGGVRAARVSASHGARVAIAEEYRYGGTCVIRGCVPKKLFVYASHFGEEYEDAVHYGWSPVSSTFDWSKLIANKDAEIDRLNGIYIKLLSNSDVKIFNDRAVVTGPHTVECGGKTITAERILIAVGAAPFIPDIPGAEYAISSNEAFHLETFPKRVIVVGGGYIAVEFAGIFNGLGAETQLLYRGDQILRGFDEDVRAAVAEGMSTRGVQIMTESDITKIEKTASGLVATLTSGEELSADVVMYATGRLPYTADLGLDSVGIGLAKNGAIPVNDFSQTSVPSIYAVGDVTDRMNLTPVAIREGQAFAETVYNNTPKSMSYEAVPTAVFSQPQVGTVGMTEAEAQAAFDTVDVYVTRFRAMKHSMTKRDDFITMKLITDAETDRVLGVHIVGGEAGEVIQAIGIAVKMGATKADFDATVAVHPTASEELVTLKTPTRTLRKSA